MDDGLCRPRVGSCYGEPYIPSLQAGSLVGDEMTLVQPLTKDNWHIVHVEKGMTIEKALKLCEAKFKVWRWTDNNLDQIVTSDRTTDKAYTVEFKPTVEADPELKNLSANNIKEKGITGCTLLERLLLELQYFEATGEHLDMGNVTLCTGSRRSYGRVPDVDWVSDSREVYVGHVDPDVANGVWRCREVVLNPSPLKLDPLPRAKNGRFAKKGEESFGEVHPSMRGEYKAGRSDLLMLPDEKGKWTKVQATIEELQEIPEYIKYQGRVYRLEEGE